VSEQHIPEQVDPRPGPDTHGQDAPQDERTPFRGTADAQPEAVTREDRQAQHAQTPAEERQALVERLKAKRDADREQRIRSYEEQQTTLQQQPLVEPDAPPQEQQPAAPAGGQEGRKYRVRYNHADVYLTEDEMARQAQIGMATGDKLAEINRTLAELRQTRDNLNRQPAPAHQAGEEDDTEPDPERPRTKGAVDIRQLAESIQTGDADDGVEALSTFRSEIIDAIRREAPQISPDDLADRVEQRLQARDAESRFRRYYAERHPDLVGHDGLQIEQRMRLHRETLSELRSLRRDDGKMLTEQELMPAIQNVDTAVAWADTYFRQGVKRADGQLMANPIQLFDRAGDATVQELGITSKRQQQPPANGSPPPADPNRQNRLRLEKRNLNEPRPAQTGLRQGGMGQQPRMTPEQRRSAAVSARRAATGFDRIT